MGTDVLWRVDRVVQSPPDRRAFLYFAGYVNAPTEKAAWAKARIWVVEYGLIVVRSFTLSGPNLGQWQEQYPLLQACDSGT